MKLAFRGTQAVETHHQDPAVLEAESRADELRRQVEGLEGDIRQVEREISSLNENLKSARIMRGLHAGSGSGAEEALRADAAEIAELRRLIAEAGKSRGKLTLLLEDARNDLRFAEQAVSDARILAARPEAQALAREMLETLEQAAKATERWIEYRKQFPMIASEWPFWIRDLAPTSADLEKLRRSIQSFCKEK